MRPDPVAVAERYRQRTRRHADRTAGALVAAFDALGPDGYVPSAVVVLVTATLRAQGYAVAYVDLMALVKGIVTATDAAPMVDPERLARAARTAGALGVGSVTRLGRSEPLRAAQDALSAGIKANPAVEGWTRHTGGNACPVCTALAGPVLPASVPMVHPHPTCACVQVPA